MKLKITADLNLAKVVIDGLPDGSVELSAPLGSGLDINSPIYAAWLVATVHLEGLGYKVTGQTMIPSELHACHYQVVRA
jgi:hypothetical protein